MVASICEGILSFSGWEEPGMEEGVEGEGGSEVDSTI